MLTIVKRNEQETRDWLATTSGFIEGIMRYAGEPITLEPFQRRFINSRSRWRSVEKSRQVGLTWAIAAEAVARSHLIDATMSHFVSYSLAEAKEMVALCDRMHDDLPLSYRKKRIVDSKLEIAFESASGTPGKSKVSRILAHPSKAPRGRGGWIYLDELAHYPFDRAVYEGSTALIIRHDDAKVTVCSTPLGKRGIFWEIARQELKAYPTYERQVIPWWLSRFFCNDPKTANKKAPFMPTQERVETFGTFRILEQYDNLPEDSFQQEYEVVYIDGVLYFFPAELVLANQYDEDVLKIARDIDEIPKPVGRLVLGYDVGRTNDKADMSIFEEIDEKYYARYFQTLDNMPFQDQEGILRHTLEHLPISKANIDKTGMGMQLAENLEFDFPHVEGVAFSNPEKERMATRMKILLQKGNIFLPKDRIITSQFSSIKKKILPSGQIQFQAPTTKDGHADRFWGICLGTCHDLPGTSEDDGEESNVGVTVIGAGSKDDKQKERNEVSGSRHDLCKGASPRLRGADFARRLAGRLGKLW